MVALSRREYAWLENRSMHRLSRSVRARRLFIATMQAIKTVHWMEEKWKRGHLVTREEIENQTLLSESCIAKYARAFFIKLNDQKLFRERYLSNQKTSRKFHSFPKVSYDKKNDFYYVMSQHEFFILSQIEQFGPVLREDVWGLPSDVTRDVVVLCAANLIRVVPQQIVEGRFPDEPKLEILPRGRDMLTQLEKLNLFRPFKKEMQVELKRLEWKVY